MSLQGEVPINPLILSCELRRHKLTPEGVPSSVESGGSRGAGGLALARDHPVHARFREPRDNVDRSRGHVPVVDGNQAWVGGVVKSSTEPCRAGWKRDVQVGRPPPRRCPVHPHGWAGHVHYRPRSGAPNTRRPSVTSPRAAPAGPGALSKNRCINSIRVRIGSVPKHCKPTWTTQRGGPAPPESDNSGETGLLPRRHPSGRHSGSNGHLAQSHDTRHPCGVDIEWTAFRAHSALYAAPR